VPRGANVDLAPRVGLSRFICEDRADSCQHLGKADSDVLGVPRRHCGPAGRSRLIVKVVFQYVLNFIFHQANYCRQK
jgi:hypothetical protein